MLDKQDSAGVEINIEHCDFVSYQAIHDYVLEGQSEAVLGVSAENLLYYEANITNSQYYVIFEDGTVQVLELPQMQASVWERIWVALGSAAAIVLGVVISAVLPGAGQVISSVLISAAIDVFVQVVVNKVPPKEVNIASVVLSAVAGAITGVIGFGGKTLTKILTNRIKNCLLKFASKGLMYALTGSLGGLASYLVTTSPESYNFIDCMKSIGTSSIAAVVLGFTDNVLRSCVKETSSWASVISVITGVISGAETYLLAVLVNGVELDIKAFITSMTIGGVTAAISVIGDKIISKVNVKRQERTLQKLMKAARSDDEVPIGKEELEARVKYLPGSNNKYWKLYDVDGNPIDKKQLTLNGGNGIIRGPGDIEIPIKNGCPVFDKYALAEVNVTGGYSTDRDVNFKKFDEMLAEKWSGDVPKEYESWFKNNNIDTEFLERKDIKLFRESNKFVWHEHQNGATGQLLPQNLHTARYGGIPHLGGISIIKQQEAQKIYDMKNNGG